MQVSITKKIIMPYPPRNRLQISACQSFYLLVNNRSMANLSKTLSDVYAEFHDEDGFLYITYASQEMFGF